MPNAFREAKDPVEQSMKIGQIDLMQKQKGATAVNTALAAAEFGKKVMPVFDAAAREAGSWFGDEGSTDRGEKLFDEYGKDKKAQTTTPPEPDPDKKKQEAVRAATLGEVAQQGMAEQGFNLSSVQGVRDAGAALNKREEARQIIAKRESERAAAEFMRESERAAAERLDAKAASTRKSERAAAAAMPKGNLGQEDWKALRAEKTGPNSFEMTRNETQAETARYLAANAPFVLEDTIAYVKEMFSPEVGEAVAANVSPGTSAQQVANVVVAAEAAKAFGESPDQAAANANPASAQSGVSQVFTQPQGPVAAGSGTLRGAGQGALDQAQAIATDPQRAVKLIDSAEGRMQRVMAYAQQIAKQREETFPSKERLGEMDVEALIALGETHVLNDDQQAMVEYLISKRAPIKNLGDLFGKRYVKNARSRFAKNVAEAKKGRYRDPVEIAKDLVTMEYKLQQGRKAQAGADKLSVQTNYLNEIGRAKAYNEWMHYFADPDFLKEYGKSQFRIKGGRGGKANQLMLEFNYNKGMRDNTENANGKSNSQILTELTAMGANRNARAALDTIQGNYTVFNRTMSVTNAKRTLEQNGTRIRAQVREIEARLEPKTAEQKKWLATANGYKRRQDTLNDRLRGTKGSASYTGPELQKILDDINTLNGLMYQHDINKPNPPKAAPRASSNPPSRPTPPPAAAPTYGSKQEVLDAYKNGEITKEKARALIAAGFGG
ncbi:MAG: hypothetical protein CMI60_04060 [Parvibaculum sp.]|nr:hypothetical protein [Parvibaculum sp.]